MQEPVKKKRERSENWLREDKILLKALVRERMRAIENKDTSTNSNASKMEAWRDLRESFNAMCKGVPRTITQLKARWSLIKMLAKKQQSDIVPVSQLAPDTSGMNESAGEELHQVLPIGSYASSSSCLSSDLQALRSTKISVPQSSDVKKKKATPVRKKKFIQYSGERLVAFEIQCREELHKAQMVNEELMKTNLLLKHRLLEKKNELYDRKLNET